MKEQQADNRITRLRRRYVNEIPFISIQRARYYTEKWRETQHGKNFFGGAGSALHEACL